MSSRYNHYLENGVSKRCNVCGQGKPEEEYARCNRRKSGRTAVCKTCVGQKKLAKQVAENPNHRTISEHRVNATGAKLCSKCKQTKPIDAYRKRGKNPDGVHGVCIECMEASRREWRENRRDPAQRRNSRAIHHEDGTKTCSKCLARKSLSEFSKRPGYPGDVQSDCLECTGRTHKERNQRLKADDSRPVALCKKCSRCKETKSQEDFHRLRSHISGLAPYCKPCSQARGVTHNPRTIAKMREKYSSDPSYRAKVRGYNKARQARLRENHLKAIAEAQVKGEMPDLTDRHTFKKQIWRTRAVDNGISISREDWVQIKASFDYSCLCCGEREPKIKLTMDHIVPVKHGGTSHRDNIQPLCLRCNCRKNDKTIDFRS